jgi:hypothetical protein
MAVKSTKWTQNIPTSSIARHSKIFPNMDFWLENIPSGNPAPSHTAFKKCFFATWQIYQTLKFKSSGMGKRFHSLHT